MVFLKYSLFSSTTFFFVGWIICCSVGQILIKRGLNQLFKFDVTNNLFKLNTIRSILKNKYISFGLLLYILSIFFSIICLSIIDISILSPMGTLIIVMVVVLSYLYLKESISLFQGIGIVLIIIGCIVIGAS